MPIEPGPCPAASALSLRAWNLLGGLDWEGLEVVADMLGIRDIEGLIADLTTIRDWQQRSAA